MSIFEYVCREREPLIKQFGDYRAYPYTQKARPSSPPVHSRATPANPIGRWYELPSAA